MEHVKGDGRDLLSPLSLWQGQELAFLCIFFLLGSVEIRVVAPYEKDIIWQAQEQRVKPCQGKL